MKKNLKNCLKILTGIIIPLQVSAYSVTIKNACDGQVRTKVEYAVCSSDEFLLGPNETKTIYTAGCCSRVIRLIGTSGSIAGSAGNYQPPLTGAGMACKDYSLTIKQSGKMLIGEHGIN